MRTATITQAATGGLRPDLTLLLDVPVQLGLSRVQRRAGGRDRLEAEGLEFHQRVRDGYYALMRQEPERWLRVDGEGEPEQVAGRLLEAVESRGLVSRELR